MLKKLIAGDIDVSSAAREAYAKDASIFRVRPKGVIYPKHEQDIQQLVQYATTQRKHGVDFSITARNGGSCMSGGPLTKSYVVDLSRYLDAVGQVDELNKTVIVEAGTMYKNVENTASPQNLLFAPYTSSKDFCGIGGMLGNNASGEMSLVYGPTSQNVQELRVVLADGNPYSFHELTRSQLKTKLSEPGHEGDIYRKVTSLIAENKHLIQTAYPNVPKNAAGYALNELWNSNHSKFNLGRIFIGSQATLGIITKATLQLVDKPKYEQMIVCGIDSIQQLTDVVRTMTKHGAMICETFDHHTYNLSQTHYPADATRASFANNRHMIVYGIFAGDTQEHAEILANKAKTVLELSLNQQLLWVADDTTKESYQAIRRYSYKMLKEMNSDTKKAMPFIEDTIVPLEHYGEFVGALEAILRDYDMTYTYAGHIGQGSIRLIPLVNRSTNAKNDIIELETRVNDLVLAFRGSISVDHNDGIIRTPYLAQQYGDELVAVFNQIKAIFDPYNIFNPGKKTAGTLEYAKDHIDI